MLSSSPSSSSSPPPPPSKSNSISDSFSPPPSPGPSPSESSVTEFFFVFRIIGTIYVHHIFNQQGGSFCLERWLQTIVNLFMQ
ncbi:Hypothetical predicted protein [Olea europaea subsp. europaea]|uniref:Uncharacterized protein n=1 Tax=Olea europaea subsp. europaea TaxID=158383 RepID=A0A8S0RFX6_OLEEU|nr:Hypothetical predicted protein [Olea europaea subsp. europaea]